MPFTSPVSQPGLSSDEFREVIGHFATGVTVVTAVDGGEWLGATASAVCSLSLEPPMLLVCIKQQSATGAAISATRRFGVNILGEHHGELAKRFATKGPSKFEDVEVVGGCFGEPLLAGALAHVECRVVDEVSAGTHTVFLAEVERAQAGDGAPLAYWRGQFGRLQLADEERAYATLRAQVAGRRLPIGEPLVVDRLATDTGLRPTAVHQALARLVGEGLVGRDEDGRFVVSPLTFDLVEDALRARCAAQLGAAALGVGALSEEQLDELRQRMEATMPLRPDGTRRSMEEWFDANQAFHLAMMRLAGSDALLAAYERFTIPGLMTRSVPDEIGLSDDIADDHVRIVEAYERGDLPAAMAAIRDDTEHALRFNVGRLRASGAFV